LAIADSSETDVEVPRSGRAGWTALASGGDGPRSPWPPRRYRSGPGRVSTAFGQGWGDSGGARQPRGCQAFRWGV